MPFINHLAIPVDDVERATAFYTEWFDARVVPSPKFPVPVSWVVVDGVQLHLVHRPGQTSDAYHFALAIESREQFEALYRRADGESAFEHETFGHHLYEAPGGVVQLYIKDPSGNIIECNYRDVGELAPDVVAGIRRWADLNEQSPWNNRASVFASDGSAVAEEDR